MGSSHSHHPSGKNLKTAFFLNVGFTILECIGGLYVNSVAILSDALHDLGDSISLGISWYLDKKSRKGASEKFSYGYQRFSLLGALINGLILLAGSIYIITEAVGRILEPQHSDAGGMVVFAVIGVAVNGYAAWKLSKGKTWNEKVVSWHLLEDVLGWVAVLIVAVVLLFKDIHYLDPALSLLIAIYVLWNVIRRLKESLFVFLQGIPPEINAEEIKSKILQIDKVKSIHHMHVWSLEGEHHVFTTHIKLAHIEKFSQLLAVKEKVRKIIGKYPFEHYTVETELDEESCPLLNK